MLASAAATVYALYLLAGRGWALLCAAFIVYTLGYHLYNKSGGTKERTPETPGETFVRMSKEDIGRRSTPTRMN